MVIRQPECIFADLPARRDDREVYHCGARGGMRGSAEHGIQAGVVLVEEGVAHHAVTREVVFVGVACAVPGYDGKGGVGLSTTPQTTCLSRNNRPISIVGTGDVV